MEAQNNLFSRMAQEKKDNTTDNSRTSTDGQSSSCLERLIQKLAHDLAEEVKQCWLDPQRVTLDKYLGHGKSL